MSEEKFRKINKDETNSSSEKQNTKSGEIDTRIAEAFSYTLIGLVASPFRYLNLITRKLYFYGGARVRKFFHVLYGVTVLMVILSSGYVRVLWSVSLLLISGFYYIAFNNNPILETEFSLTGFNLKDTVLTTFSKFKSNVAEKVNDLAKENNESNVDETVNETKEAFEENVKSKEPEFKQEQTEKPKRQVIQSANIKLDLTAEINEEIDNSINQSEELFGDKIIQDLEDKPINNINLDELIAGQPEVKREVERINEDVTQSMEDFFNAFAKEFTSSSILETKPHREFVKVSEEYSVEDDI